MKPNRLGLIVFFLLVVAYSGVAWSQSVQIRVEHANARSQPSSSGTIVAVLNRGDIHQVTDDVPYWYQIALADNQVWVAKSLCKLVIDAPLAPAAAAAETSEDAEALADNAQPLNDLFVLPTFGATITIPGCTPTVLNADFTICPAEGESQSGGQARNALANQKKNRVAIECTYSSLTFDQVLALRSLPGNVRTLPSNDPRASYLNSLESRPVVIEGFLAMVKRAGKESTNCYSSSRKDLHVELVASDQGDPADVRNEVVVTEVSPWLGEANTAWTSTNLGQFASYRNGYAGNMQRAPGQVRIYGWLYYDDPHASDGSVGSWRGTAWELHPITRIEVFENGNWREIQ